MKYTVIFLFTKDLSEILLVHKNRSVYTGKLNGVGGKIEMLDPSTIHSAIREIKEETDVTLKPSDIHWITTIVLPRDQNMSITLHVYCACVDKNDVHQMEDETLEWFDVKTIMKLSFDDAMLAGDGNLLYLINLALIKLREE